MEDDGPNTCPSCSPSVPLNSSQGQCVLSHIGSHILHDIGVDRASEPCGLCLRPAPMCLFYLKKGKGANASLKIDFTKSRGCPNMLKYSYSVASKSTASSPCSNIPLPCPLCPNSDPAVWRYNMEEHICRVHPMALRTKYQSLWMLTRSEKELMKEIWTNREDGVPI